MNTVQARRRKEVRDQIVGCSRCWLRRQQWVREPVPFHGPTPARYGVVGEAPGSQENRAGRPFIGPAGKLIRSWLEDAGLDPDAGLWMNRVCCYPHGTPDEVALRACGDNFRAQLGVVGSPYILLVGNVALTSIRWDLRVTSVNGYAISHGGRWFMPVLHPAYVLRNRQADPVAREAVEKFAFMVKEELPARAFCGTVCAKYGCGRPPDRWDDNEIPWCEQHWDHAAEKTRAERTAKAKRKAARVKIQLRQAKQGRLL